MENLEVVELLESENEAVEEKAVEESAKKSKTEEPSVSSKEALGETKRNKVEEPEENAKDATHKPYGTMIDIIGLESNSLSKKREENSEEAKRRAAIQELRRFKETKRILWAEVTGSEIEKNAKMVAVIANYNGFRIVIPEKAYFTSSMEMPMGYNEASPAEKLRIKQRLASYQIGSHVCFTVNTVHELPADPTTGMSSYIIIGDRLDALEIMQDYHFKHKRYNVGQPCGVHVGDFAEAHVLSVKSREVLVEVLGVETRIDYHEISDDYVENCKDIVKNGDNLKVRIKRIYTNEDTNGKIYLSVSARLFSRPEDIANMKKNSTYSGTVIAYNDNKKLYTVKLKNNVNALVFSSNVKDYHTLVIGDEVIVSVTSIKENYVQGIVMKINQ